MVSRRLLPLLAACALLPALSSSVTADWGLNWGEMEWGLDTDGDGLSDIHEAELGTNPNNPDTDGDNVSDGTGTGGGELDSAVERLINTAIICLEQNPQTKIETVYFLAYTDRDLAACRKVLLESEKADLVSDQT